MALDQRSYPFVPKTWFVNLDETVPDSDYHQAIGNAVPGKELPMPGAMRWEEATFGRGPYRNVPVHGLCCFRWGVNRNGSAIGPGVFASRMADQAVTADAAGTVNTFTDTGQFTEHEEVGNILHILDDAGGAGAAPEGEVGLIVKNDANTLYLQSDNAQASALTAATASGDTGRIISVAKCDLAAIGDTKQDVFGGALVSVADNYWGWFLCYGWLMEAAVVAAGTTVDSGSAHIGLITTTNGLLTNSSTSAQNLLVARSGSQLTTDTVHRYTRAFVDVLFGLQFTTA